MKIIKFPKFTHKKAQSIRHDVVRNAILNYDPVAAHCYLLLESEEDKKEFLRYLYVLHREVRDDYSVTQFKYWVEEVLSAEQREKILKTTDLEELANMIFLGGGGRERND